MAETCGSNTCIFGGGKGMGVNNQCTCLEALNVRPYRKDRMRIIGNVQELRKRVAELEKEHEECLGEMLDCDLVVDSPLEGFRKATDALLDQVSVTSKYRERAEKAEFLVAELKEQGLPNPITFWCPDCARTFPATDEFMCGGGSTPLVCWNCAQKPRPMSEAPADGGPVRVWVTTSDGSAAWFDARYDGGVWRESRIEHCERGFKEQPGKVLRPSLFLPSTPMPDQSEEKP